MAFQKVHLCLLMSTGLTQIALKIIVLTICDKESSRHYLCFHQLLTSISIMLLSKPRSTRYSARLILVIGLLASLCLSVGEGISLLPFPNSGVANGATQILHPTPLRTYIPSLHHSGNGLMRSIKLKKNQRRDPNPCPQGANCKATLVSPPACHLTSVSEARHYSVRPLRASVTGRAPPSS